MKVLRKSEIVRLRQVEHVNAERYILSRVQHPFIVDLFATQSEAEQVGLPGAVPIRTTEVSLVPSRA